MKKVMIRQAMRRTAQVSIQNVVKSTYFTQIPLDEMSDALKDMGIVMVQEDFTEWSGFLCGDQGECFIRLAPMTTMKEGTEPFNAGLEFYTPYENTGLRMTWYKCESRRDRKFEVITYIS